jgi:diguanylate cyclase (GGDEF)-like protein
MLVALAAAVCALTSFTAINLLRHAQALTGRARHLWLAVTAITTGFGIWATHFIAMLAFSPGMTGGYHLPLTLLSLAAAIYITGFGLFIALTGNRRAAVIGGIVVAAGIATTHHVGMAAWELQATIVHDIPLTILSLLAGAVFGALSLPIGLFRSGRLGQLISALFLALAICSLHFINMSAITIVPDPTVAISELSIPPAWLAGGVALISAAIIAMAMVGIALSSRERRRSVLEQQRMLGLANAAIEGLLVCDGDIIVTANASFAKLIGMPVSEFIGASRATLFPDLGSADVAIAESERGIETGLRHGNGMMIAVEILTQSIDFDNRPHQVIAVRDLRERNEAASHIRYLANYDTLTSLPNRRMFNARLEQDITGIGTGKLAVLCLDLDRFKEINDLFGHTAGDQVLQRVSSQVSALLKDDQMMARLGGDEFGIIMPGLTDIAEAEQLAARIIETLTRKGSSPEFGSTGTSIGIVICPDHGTSRESLMFCADTALYRAKADGRTAYRCFEPGMGDAVRERRQIEIDLRQAIPDAQFSLVYQPQEARVRGVVVGFEALLRWTHPTRGAVPPNVFIPLAEDCGAILDIGEWALRTACLEAATWLHPLSIAVNVSAVQIYHDGFVESVAAILAESGLSPDRLELEITETALIRDINRALTTLRRVKALGVSIAMDDFGTGFSSLSNLRAFPFDKIKIDGSFIKSVNSNEDAATIVRAVVGLGRGLGMPVLAEGVETEAELDFLRNEMCDEVQGYFLGRPTSIDQYSHLTGVVPPATVPPIGPDATHETDVAADKALA